MLRLTCTSSSFLIGIDRTLYFCLSSLDKGADISTRRICDGAVKCRLRFLLLEDDTSLLNFMLIKCCLNYLKKIDDN